MKTHRILRETVLAVGLVAFGLICLPALIYTVGQLILGEYESGLLGLYSSIGDALADGNGFAWFLVISPYLGISLIRIAWRLRRQRRMQS